MLAPLIRILSRAILQPLARYYTSKDRWYSFKGVRIKVLEGVFHPGLFFSTRYLLSELLKLKLKGKKLLELGAGSGLISFVTESRGASVTATDINPAAIRGLELNRKILDSKLRIIHSDLLDSVPAETFDFIIINPPYYPREARNDAEKAWYCGEHFEYFDKLFNQISQYMQPETQVWVSLSGDCRFETIQAKAKEHGLRLELRCSKRFLWEIQFIYLLKTYI